MFAVVHFVGPRLFLPKSAIIIITLMADLD